MYYAIYILELCDFVSVRCSDSRMRSTTRNVQCVVCVSERCEDKTETRMEEEDAKEEEEDVLLVVSDLSDQVQGGWCCRQSGGVTSWVAAQGVMV